MQPAPKVVRRWSTDRIPGLRCMSWRRRKFGRPRTRDWRSSTLSICTNNCLITRCDRATGPARENAIMNGIASQLSDDDKRNVSSWFASQTSQLGTARNKQTLDFGQRIWRAGLPEKSLPACSGCHNPAGQGIPVQFPRLAAQHADYVEATLRDFRHGTRRNNAAMRRLRRSFRTPRCVRSGLCPGCDYGTPRSTRFGYRLRS